MNLAPVVARELRVSARQPFTYSSRMLAVAALVAVVLVFGMEDGLGQGMGGRIFRWLHLVLLLSIWCMAPLLTADAISRERREGTLVLLSLTSLTFADVAWAKAAAHLLRAFSLWLAVMPVMVIPSLVGGVSWMEVCFSAIVSISSLLLAIGGGLLASSRTRSYARSLALAALLNSLFLLLLLVILGASLYSTGARGRATLFAATPMMGSAFASFVEMGFGLAFNPNGFWQVAVATFGAPLMRAYVLTGVLTLLLFVILVRFAAWNVGVTWRDTPESARMAWWRRTFCTPVFFRHVLRSWMSRKLQRNPIGWLEQRTWSGRLVMWSWFAVVVSVYSTILTDYNLFYRGFTRIQSFLAWLLVGSMAISAAGSFRRERETGMLELLLVAPLKEWTIISGRVRGLWSQFLPAFALLTGVWIYLGTIPGIPSGWRPITYFLITFATLPVIGLYFSLARSNFLSSFVRTLLVGVIIPAAIARWSDVLTSAIVMLGFPLSPLVRESEYWFTAGTIQIIVAVYFARKLERKLSHRQFALEKV